MFCIMFSDKYENVGKNLFKPHRYKAMCGIKVSRVVSGCVSSHSLLMTTEGKVYSWGKSLFSFFLDVLLVI